MTPFCPELRSQELERLIMNAHTPLSTLIAVTATVFVTAILPTPSRASDIEIIVTGTVLSGTDSSGVFGLAPGTNLAGKPYVLTFTFDDTAGTESFTSSQSYIKSTATSNPGTAVLQIGSGSFAFGTTQYNPVTQSDADKFVGGGSSYALLANSGPFGSEWNDIQGTIDPATGTVLSADPNWEASFTDSNLSNGSDNHSLFFGILEESAGLSASGDLTASTITVDGIDS